MAKDPEGLDKLFERLGFGSILGFIVAGIKPYEPHNHREKGLLTGSEGEFIIYRKADEPKEGIEGNESSDETADGEQQNIGGKEKNREIKSGEQQP